MKVHLHGRLVDLFGREVEVDLRECCTIADLRRRLGEFNPASAAVLEGGRTRACVGDAIVLDSHIVAPTDEVEFIPPVSGG